MCESLKINKNKLIDFFQISTLLLLLVKRRQAGDVRVKIVSFLSVCLENLVRLGVRLPRFCIWGEVIVQFLVLLVPEDIADEL